MTNAKPREMTAVERGEVARLLFADYIDEEAADSAARRCATLLGVRVTAVMEAREAIDESVETQYFLIAALGIDDQLALAQLAAEMALPKPVG
jgi:hypothetical protein